MSSKKIRVLIVDDSAFVRDILTQGLLQDPMLEVVGSVPDPYAARDKILELRPDVLTLDVEMPKMDGVEFLRKLMPQYPIPVVMVSSLTDRGKQVTIDALEAGAIDFVIKPKSDVTQGLKNMMIELRTKIKIASTANVSYWKHKRNSASSNNFKFFSQNKSLSESKNKVIAIGASTGGTEAIKEVICQFPASAPGVVIVQHMPAGFTKMFAERLNRLCDMEVKEAEDNDQVMQGRVLIAPGARQMRLVRCGDEYRVHVAFGEPVSGHCPSVDVLMHSVAENVGANALGVMLTGMGKDGALGMKAMREMGARCIAQDEASCVVYGMPKEAYGQGGAEKLVPLNSIAGELLKLLSRYN